MNPLVTVGIVNYNATPFLAACVDSVRSLQGVQPRTIILANASVNGSRGWLQQRFAPPDLILNEANLGFARAHNQIIRRMEGRYYLTLNPDVSLASDYASSVIAQPEARPDFGWGMGNIYRALPDATPTRSLIVTDSNEGSMVGGGASAAWADKKGDSWPGKRDQH
jgi:hypothetical protein